MNRPRVTAESDHVPVAVNVMGLPPRTAAAVAVSVFGPASGPRIQDVTAAIPSAPVVTGVEGLTVPAPKPTTNVTLIPATGLPNWSRTITEGGIGTALLTGALWLSPAFTAIETAAPGVMSNPLLVAPVGPVALAVSV